MRTISLIAKPAPSAYQFDASGNSTPSGRAAAEDGGQGNGAINSQSWIADIGRSANRDRAPAGDLAGPPEPGPSRY
jgi:hypothetical protein